MVAPFAATGDERSSRLSPTAIPQVASLLTGFQPPE
jgi:hypothetical protein